MKIDNLKNISKIWPEFTEGKLVLFIGAGFSKNAGSFDWKRLTEELLRHPIIQPTIGSCDSKQPYEIIIDYCKSILLKNGFATDFWSAIRRSIIRDPVLYPDKYLPLVKKISEIDPLPIIITTNFESFLEDSNCFDLSKIFYKLKDFKSEKISFGSIFHIHGYIEKLEDALITKTQYLELYRKQNFRRFIAHIYKSYTILFIGYNLGDDDLKNVFLSSAEGSNHEHFALMPDDHEITEFDKKIYLEKYKINIVEYGPVEKFAEALKYIIDDYNISKETITVYEKVGREILDE